MISAGSPNKAVILLARHRILGGGEGYCRGDFAVSETFSTSRGHRLLKRLFSCEIEDPVGTHICQLRVTQQEVAPF